MAKKDKKKSKKIAKKIYMLLLIIIVAIGIGCGVLLSRYNYEELDLANLGINDTNLDNSKAKNHVNIALFGIDARSNSFVGRSDSIMVVTLDYEHKLIKLSSFMRDSVVKIEEHGYEKQTHAYSYGGAQLAVKTLNTNYDLDIQNYITINFSGLEKVINKIGGVTVKVGSNEVSEINKYIKELNKIHGGVEASLLSGSGSQTLTGRQAVAYSRIRKVGGGDSERTERQREVLDQVIDKLLKKSHSELVSLAYEFMPYVKTSFSIGEIIDTASDYNTFKNAKREEFRYPKEYKGAMVSGSSVVRPTTLETNVVELIKFIYDLEEYEPSEVVKQISQEIENK